MTEKPLVTVSGRKVLFTSKLHQRIVQDLPVEGIEWRRRLDSNAKSVYIDVDFVDFDIDNVERSSERISKLAISDGEQQIGTKSEAFLESTARDQGDGEKKMLENNNECMEVVKEQDGKKQSVTKVEVAEDERPPDRLITRQPSDVSQAFFNQTLLGRPILHTYWADKSDFEDENQKSQFDEWIGNVQASSCSEWAIVIIEDGDFKAQLGTALFKSKLQSTTSQANTSVASISSQASNTSFLDRMKKGLSTIFQSDSNSDKWLTLIDQNRLPESKAQESYLNFIKKFRNVIMASFSKQIELFEEQLRVKREMRNMKNWNFFSYFSMQEELAFAFEFLTLFDEALVQYDLLDALFTEHISSPNFNREDDPLYEQWTSFNSWQGLCLDMANNRMKELRQRISDRKASLLDLRNYLFAKQCDLMLMQNKPWRVAASATVFLQNCIREHRVLNLSMPPGAITCWSFVSALEVLQKCECYSCTSTMENYSLHTVDIWNCARKNLLELGHLSRRMPGTQFDVESEKLIALLLDGLGQDPHGGVSYQDNEISPYARLKDALASGEQYSKHLIEITELTLGTYKHIGRKRHALMVGKELAEFYVCQKNYKRALPFFRDLEKTVAAERWERLLEDMRKTIAQCDLYTNSTAIEKCEMTATVTKL